MYRKILDYSLFKKKNILNDYDFEKNYSDSIKKKIVNIYDNTDYTESTFITSSARSSLNIILKSLSLPKRSEILILGHTCSEIPNVILSNNLVPIFIDIDLFSFSFEINDLKNKFSENTKAIIIQHHLGIIDNNTIKFLSNKNIIIIEDCALHLAQ